MDYYQQSNRTTHAANAAQNAHQQQYMQYSSQAPQSGSNMFYQQQTMPAQSQQTAYSHFPIQPASTTSPLEHDFSGAQHQHNSSAHQYHSHNAHGHGHQQQQQHQVQHQHQPHHANSGLQTIQHHPPQQQQQQHNQRRPAAPAVSVMQRADAPVQQIQPTQELPLRIVIDSRYVGAIIGSGGSNIKEITKESRARVVVDVNRSVKDAQGHSEKIISIIGPLDCCSKACVKIMEVVNREHNKDETKTPNEIELKIRAHNQLVGRLIGKQGITIKKIMSETSTNISVSNEQSTRNSEFPPFQGYPEMLLAIERTITVKGPTIENVSHAEQKISAKLRQSYELDLQNRMSVNAIPGNAIVPGMMGHVADPYALIANAPRGPTMSTVVKTTRMWVPNNLVGAIIGAKGNNIRMIMRNSGAVIKIDGGDKKKEDVKKEEGQPSESKEERHQLLDDGTAGDSTFSAEKSEEEKPRSSGSPTGNEKKDEERLITISGHDVQQYRAQFFIFQRVAEQTQTNFEEVKLRTEVSVPSRVVGRIIGKGGQNVRELQRITGATVQVKIPEEERNNGTTEQVLKDDEDSTIVRIIGTLNASHNVQARLGQLIGEFSRMGVDGGRKRNNNDERKHSPPSNHSD